MNKRYLALIAAFLATTIYGINHTVAKEVMPVFIGSSGFIMLRLLGDPQTPHLSQCGALGYFLSE